ncbi:hypothetical protein, partial [Sphingomonas sp. 8AM]|uniref:hypothetical protein n=1 Tax=Sphingomonas sp. 8AM TaxID=2653170 RepID=UPI001F2FB454
PAVLLAQHRDDLLLAEPALLHIRLLTKADSSSNWRSFRGARHSASIFRSMAAATLKASALS